ncbi:MAG: hypothetical protein IPG34_19390 [Rhodocyclaceae bacterium]|nr:hypothetical protein [Rhodocyclaceae bacterium]
MLEAAIHFEENAVVRPRGDGQPPGAVWKMLENFSAVDIVFTNVECGPASQSKGATEVATFVVPGPRHRVVVVAST